MDSKKILIQLNNASFKYQGGDNLFVSLKLTVKEGARIAVVGVNGSGKSTLLKILSGIIKLDEGSQIIDCKPYYVPQIDLSIQQTNVKIYEYISQYYDEWWDILTELEKLFNLELNPEAEAKTLSGGELMKLNLTIAVKHNPNVLVLDEPTNHLDIQSLDQLIKFINVDNKDKYTYIIVSHDVFFLDTVITEVWELENKTVTAYGGNYSFYKEQKELHLRGIKKQYDIAKSKLEKTEEMEQKTLEKNERKANEAKRAFMKGSIDKRAYSVGKNAASSLQESKTLTIDKLKEKLKKFWRIRN
jgi:ATPase subunit of ABC transporter with duplicated ATPase domains